MKKYKLILLLIIMISSISVNAQNWLTAGNPLTGIEKLGSTNNFSLNFFTNNTQKMTILSGGNVGIGLSAPLHLLDISGGDLNLQTTYGYMLGGTYVLRNNNITSNLYVGLNAGNNNATTNCIFVSYKAGNAFIAYCSSRY